MDSNLIQTPSLPELNAKQTLPSVSICTLTQLSRNKSIQILAQLINEQDYPNIIEWVIVEGSQSQELARINEQQVIQLQAICKIPIKYIPFEEGAKLGRLRNKGNQTAIGAIIVCMDDDDYYPPVRVSHAVTCLSNSDKLIAGCSKLYIYDYASNRLIQYKGFGTPPNLSHSTNACLAYKQEYLLNHQHQEAASYAEESSFTNNFSEPMLQLDSDKTVVAASHSLNTIAKEHLFAESSQVDELNDQDLLDKIIPEKYRHQYRKIYCNN